MLKSINRYELGNNVTIDMLSRAGFHSDYGWMKEIEKPKMTYFKMLDGDIELWIEISVKEESNIEFDDEKNVAIIDDDFGQYYYGFYNDVSTPYINKVIEKYNKVMDGFVEKGILKRKKLENEKDVQKVYKNT